MALLDKLKKTKLLTREQVSAYLDTEEGEDLIIEKVNKAMPDFYQNINTNINTITTPDIKADVKPVDIFEKKPEPKGD